MRGLEPLDLDARFEIVVEAMKHEARQAEEILDRYQHRTRIPRRRRRRMDAHLERAKILRHELGRREELSRVKADRARLEETIRARLAEPVVAEAKRWENFRASLELIEGMLAEDPGARAQAEIVSAYVVDVLAGIGLDYRDPDVLYAVLSGAGMMTELAANGQRRGEVDPATVVAIARVAQTFTAALLPYLPLELRPNLDLEIPDTPAELFGDDPKDDPR